MNSSDCRECIDTIKALNDLKEYNSVFNAVKKEVQSIISSKDSKDLLEKTRRAYNHKLNQILKKYGLYLSYIYDDLDDLWDNVYKDIELNDKEKLNELAFRSKNSKTLAARNYYRSTFLLQSAKNFIIGEKDNQAPVIYYTRKAFGELYSLIPDLFIDAGIDISTEINTVWNKYKKLCLNHVTMLCYASMRLKNYEKMTTCELKEKLNNILKKMDKDIDTFNLHAKNLSVLKNMNQDQFLLDLRQQIEEEKIEFEAIKMQMIFKEESEENEL